VVNVFLKKENAAKSNLVANAPESKLKALLVALINGIYNCLIPFIDFVFHVFYSDSLFHLCAEHISYETRQNARE
jgi:hypothetical protein